MTPPTLLVLSRVPLLAVLGIGCASGRARPAEQADSDLVAVSYTVQPGRHLTGAVSALDETALRKRPVGRVEEMLQGRLPGVVVSRLPDGGYSVRVRGAGSFGPGGAPLFVVDGMPVHSMREGGALDAIRPQDVVRIDVLRDASSTSAYGVQGVHGVILITTRRGGH